MSVVDLNGIKSCLEGPLDGSRKVFLELFNFLKGHLSGLRVIFVPRNRRWRNNIIGPAVDVFAGDGTRGQPRRTAIKTGLVWCCSCDRTVDSTYTVEALRPAWAS